MPEEYVSIVDAAAECGMTLDQFLTELVLLGDLDPVGGENYLPSDRAMSNGTIIPNT